MKLSLLYRPSVPASACPYRLLDEQDQEIAWAKKVTSMLYVQLAPQGRLERIYSRH